MSWMKRKNVTMLVLSLKENYLLSAHQKELEEQFKVTSIEEVFLKAEVNAK